MLNSHAALSGLPGSHRRGAHSARMFAVESIRDAKALMAEGKCHAAADKVRNALYASGELIAHARDSESKPLLKAAIKIAQSAGKVHRKLKGVCIRD